MDVRLGDAGVERKGEAFGKTQRRKFVSGKRCNGQNFNSLGPNQFTENVRLTRASESKMGSLSLFLLLLLLLFLLLLLLLLLRVCLKGGGGLCCVFV